ncbi:endolysin [Microbacterium phage Mabodamaca]|uniref:Endolysin n=1 Tax=Microbacterium phage Mabodamaca TaxID=3078574 RepID=A0AA96SJB2_9CAUD|nr:endolysin [Microbacterium phage Mabodamaca]
MWLRDDAAAAINALEDKYGVIRINSAGRTVAEQNDLIRRFDRGEPGIYMPARPAETSSHVKNGGEAVDVFNYTSDRAKLEEFGFEWYGPKDKVHYTFRGRKSSGALTVTVNRDVASIQRLVGSNPDGIYGPDTRAKVAAWQGRNGLVADGIWGPASDAKGFPAAPSSSYPRGSYKEYQAALNRFGYGLAVDGIWGPASSNALAHFQRSRGLVADRIVGPKTRAALGI